ncbi:helix-turn-helix domain-containing protein [Amycolatopsis sp. lyj-108]|uniref:helix-turn-helix domain-containing protein n=1 Tax=Amycolatopsis sp. lyj-108 TaxID=2789286 RepID=UPI00397E26EE
MTTISSSDEQAFQRRADELERAVRDFRSGLIQMWREAGDPRPYEMAVKTDIPESVFGLFLQDQAMPTRREVEAFLAALDVSVLDRVRWLTRFDQLEDRYYGLAEDRASGRQPQLPKAGDDLEDLIGKQLKISSPLSTALKAETPGEIQAALRALRAEAKLSLNGLVAATPIKNRLSRSTLQRIEAGDRPPTRDQVMAFVKGCGQKAEQLRLWEHAVLTVGKPKEALTARVEVSAHPVRYPFGKSEGEVVDEVRIQVTPTVRTALKTLATAGPGAVVLGAVVVLSSKSQSRVKTWIASLVLGIVGGWAAMKLSKKIDTLPDEVLDTALPIMEVISSFPMLPPPAGVLAKLALAGISARRDKRDQD